MAGLRAEERFQGLERIGRGSFGAVYRCTDVVSRETVAVKIIDLEQAEDEIDDIQQEIAVMSQCDSPYVTRYFGSYVSGTKLWIVMEYVGGGSVLVRSTLTHSQTWACDPSPASNRAPPATSLG